MARIGLATRRQGLRTRHEPVVQVGTPEEILQDPANEDVAGALRHWLRSWHRMHRVDFEMPDNAGGHDVRA